jgi:hypothetical protein
MTSTEDVSSITPVGQVAGQEHALSAFFLYALEHGPGARG